jgi:response regulator RpfG family c-di-GMP phosphodiesterase
MFVLQPTSLKALIVDDNQTIAMATSAMLQRRGFKTEAVNDPNEALRLVRNELFDLALLDINLEAEINGLDLLRLIKEHTPSTTCVMLTGEGTLKRILKALEFGAQGFVIKPATQSELFETIDLALEKTRLFREHVRMLRFTPLLEGATDALLNALEAKDLSTKNHSQRVSYYSLGIAKAFKFDPEEMAVIRIGAQFHDIGKIGIPDSILLKPGPLTPDEREIMKTHTEIGWKIMEGIKGLRKSALIVRGHHERFDGKGYPDGLRGDQIPIGARIASVADCFEAMVSPRVYSRGRPAEDAMMELRRCAGTQFDPDVVEVFLKLMDVGELFFQKAPEFEIEQPCEDPVLPLG